MVGTIAGAQTQQYTVGVWNPGPYQEEALNE